MSLNTNTQDLNEILDTMNNLPLGGGGLRQIGQMIDESGVLDSTEGTVEEKVEELIEIIEENTLPDWDDDSPIIASGKGYVGRGTWELTEKGTLRWDTSDFRVALFTSSSAATIVINYPEYIAIKDKVKQIYIPDGTTAAEFFYMPNCVRVRLPNSLTSKLSMAGMTALRELNLNFDCYAGKPQDYCCSQMVSLEKVELSPLTTTISRDGFSKCYCLKSINLDNIIVFEQACFNEALGFSMPIIFNSELVSIGTQSFRCTNIPSVVFRVPTTVGYPTIASNSFANCYQLLDIYVPWAEGEVANAPWGATNATIHYNTQYDADGNPITE